MAAETRECPICKDEIQNPRLLPCIHAFCLECLERYCRDNLPGDDVPCPECRTDFEIPKNGVADLPVRTLSTSRPKEKSLSVPSKTCAEHEERLRMYCLDCGMKVCSMCCLEGHRTRSYQKYEQVMEKFVRSIDDAVDPLTTRVERLRGAAAQVEAERNKLLDNINEVEQKIKGRGQQIIQTVEFQMSDLLQELQSLKSAAEKVGQCHLDAVILALTEMDSFRTSSLELKSKGLPVDITQAVNDVHDRAKVLLQTYIIPSEYHAPSYKFTPVDIDELLTDGQNFIGHVVKVEDSGNYHLIVFYSFVYFSIDKFCSSAFFASFDMTLHAVEILFIKPVLNKIPIRAVAKSNKPRDAAVN